MAKRCYNTFVVVDCKNGRNLIVTSSARKAEESLCIGRRIEVWNANEKVEVIYNRMYKEKNPMRPYIAMEKEYIRKKQQEAEQRNGERMRTVSVMRF